MKKELVLSNRFIAKLSISLLLLIVLMGSAYIFITVYFTNKYMEETAQKLNAPLANHLIEEKFQQAPPFLEDGSVNKEIFGDLMHDMMAVNRSIEVYLLSMKGEVLYSVVLDHSNPNEPAKVVNLEPVKQFIAANGDKYILGDDPRTPGENKIFSAAPFDVEGHEGYIYIVLAGQAQREVYDSLFASYFMSLGVGASVLTMVFALILGFISIWFLTKNLRTIIQTVKRFREGDMNIRVANPEKSDLAVLAQTFNDMADTIEKNVEEIKSVDTLRRELIANVSHDLRTPLSIMKGYAESFQMRHDELSREEQNKYLTIIQESADKLSRLVSQLFEYSKLEAKQVVPNKEPFALTDLVLDLIAKFEMLAEKKDINFDLKAEKNLPLVFADISLVERAIQNLMDNALKFTPRGGNINLEIKSRSNDIEFVITDSGPGIKESDQRFIFERFRQTRKSDKVEGAGLGLSIVKKIMELHNTSIQVISAPERGSSFQFYLPSYSG